jgi:membrane protein
MRPWLRCVDLAGMQDPNAGAGVRQRFVESLKADDVTGIAAEIAYRFLFAVFPFGLFAAALGAYVATYFHVENPAAQVVAGLGDNLPPSIADSLRPELERLLSKARPDLLSVGALGALWAATGGTTALVKGIHRAYGVPEDRPFLLRYVIAIALTLFAAFGAIGAFVTVVGGAALTEQVSEGLGLGATGTAVVALARLPLVFLGMTLVVGVLYRHAPKVVAPWRWIFAGAAVFAAGWILATALLGLYVTRFTDYGATYGSLAGVIVLMIWFYLTGALLVIGAEVTSALAWARSAPDLHIRREEAAATEAIDRAAEHAKRGIDGVNPRTTSDRLSRR